jgi:TRAP-type transport system periplasmic protein
VRQAVEAAAAEATAAQRQFAAAEDDDVLAKLRLGQNEIIHLTDAERSMFVEAVAPVIEKQRHLLGEQLFRDLET